MKTLAILLFLSLTRAFSEDVAVTLGWDANAEVDLAGYRLHIGTAAGVYGPPVAIAGATTKTINLPVGVMHFATVTAVNTSGQESLKSKELVFQVYRPGEAVPPAAPTGLKRTDIQVTLQSSPDLKLWAYEATHSYSVEGARHFWRLVIDKP